MIRYLVIAPSWVGDLVIAGGLFRSIKEKEGEAAHITVLASPWNQDLLHRMSDVDAVIPADLPHGVLNLKKRYVLAKSLRGQFDVAIILPNSWKSALIPFWAGIPIRRGWLGEARYFLLNQIFKNPKRFERLADRFAWLSEFPERSVAASSSASRLSPDAAVRAALLTRFNLSQKQPILALCPGAAFGSAKRWPTHHFRTLSDQLISQGWQIWIFGTQNEKVLALEIAGHWGVDHPQVHIFSGLLSLAETNDLLSVAQCVISNDSGLMHVAAALGRPTLGLYGSTSPTYTPPLGEFTKILINPVDCQPCFKRECPLGHLACLEGLLPMRVLGEITQWDVLTENFKKEDYA